MGVSAVAATGPGEARATLGQARALVAAATRLATARAAATQTAVAAVDAAREEIVGARLDAMPVDRLREITGGRLRLPSLERAGYGTVGAVLRATTTELVAVPGVGATTARQATAAARQLHDALEDGTHLRLDADARPASHTAVVAGLRRLEASRGDVAALDAEAQGVLDELRGLVDAAHPVGGRVRMFLTRGERRVQALDAAQRLAAVLARPAVGTLPERLAQGFAALGGPDPAPEDLWADFAARAVDHNALLSEFVGVEPDTEAAHGFLPEAVARRVSAHPLDTDLLIASLRGYQAFGAKFALAQERAILGDEMGLGKTVQALAAMCHLRSAGETHFVVVCPASVVANWLHEIPRHTRLTGHRLHGPGRDAAMARWAQDGGVAVTTFATVRALELPDDVAVALLVVDEAHYIKNPAAKRTRSVGEWITRARRALLMTGTPMENRVEEFAVLVGHVNPGLAGRLGPRAGLLGPDAFRAAVGPVYLRRNQADVLTELPPRIEALDWVTMTDADLRAYRAAVASGNFMAMRQAAYAPGHVDGSAKLERLVDIVDEASREELKVVVFSFFLGVLDTVAAAVGDRALGPLTGALTPTERQALVDEFTERAGPAVLVSQIQAGGVGLNIQAGSVVILTEPQWKPSSEEQAIARCHRMGQARSVQVHRLLAEDSVDELMRTVLAGKAGLFDDYARPSALKDATPDAADISDLHLTREVASQAEAERDIIARERERLGLDTPSDAEPAGRIT